MPYYIRRGSSFIITDEANLDIHDRLPVGNYVVQYDDSKSHFYLESMDSFAAPSKVYGDTEKSVQRMLTTYQSRTHSTGVLLSGEKGSGKTLMGKMICIRGAELGIPTLVINTPWCGDTFNKFIQEIDQECIILFDEFEKVYDRDKQEELLTLLDGVFPSRKLFVFTCNDKYRIDAHMTNRPGRIYYALEFQGLDVEFIREYCQENLNDKGFIEAICRISSLFDQFNFDMLKALVEEMNRFGESPVEALKFLNAKPDRDNGGSYDVTLFINGQPAEGGLFPSIFSGNPLKSSSFDLEQEFDDDEKPDVTHRFTLDDLVKIDPDRGEFTYQQGTKKAVFTRRKQVKFNLANGYNDLFD